MKNTIRKINKIRRSEMCAEEVREKSNDAAGIFIKSEFYKNSSQIMLYMPLGNETDTSEIIQRAFSDGKKCIFPVTNPITGEITPYYANKGTSFKKGAFSVFEPENNESADVGQIDVFIVPGIAFDRTGTRVGFGKGCYDRFLKYTDAVKIGFCYDFQIADCIPADKHDIKMDFLITESELIKCE